ncbi:photosystem I reaction center subunit V, chloroplastic [Telopea speciosissima]|uniref:photosystem I reaction center subunit V, chloroplastic n=1 Tax=Telopea speciosissima TaxID=54955 RepID=UPI001CC7D73F|nr:photosystem I reaction center subunit V, chloroplastic [Telopea speciosissima]
MASTTLFSTLAPSSSVQKHHHHAQAHLTSVPSHQCFQGLRPMKPTDAAQLISSSSASISGRKNSKSNSKSYKRGICRAELNPSLVISLSTGLSLFLGRFVFFNFQRENVAKQGLPEQNGMTHFEAGDTRAKEYVSLLKSNDPVGFNIVDVLSWGSIGHIVAYYILATSSNGYDPKFFD